MTPILFLILIISLSILLPILLKTYNNHKMHAMPISKIEGFENYTLEQAETNYANPMLPINSEFENELLVQDEFHVTGRKGISNNGSNNIWWHYPTFKVGSYKQITNNILHARNPDEGTCMPASMCGALYKNRVNKSNYIKPLPPVNPTCDGVRVGYFQTDINLLPFRTDETNILY